MNPETQSKCTCDIEYPRYDEDGPRLVRCDWCKSLESTNTKLVELLKVAMDAFSEIMTISQVSSSSRVAKALMVEPAKEALRQIRGR